MAKITRSKVEQAQAGATKLMLDYFEKEFEALRKNAVRVINRLNESLDSELREENRKAAKALREKAEGRLAETRAIKKDFEDGETVPVSRIQEARKGFAEIEAELANVEGKSTDKTAETAHVRRWSWITFGLAALGLVIAGLVFLGKWENFHPNTALQWLRWVTLFAWLAFGFLAGGAIGSFIEERRARRQEVAA
jgi:hypothetical protein